MRFKNLLRVFVLLTLAATEHGYLFDIIGNVTLSYTDGSDPFMTKTMDKDCECRSLCIVQPPCMAFSVHRAWAKKQLLCKLFINETQQNPTNPKKYKLVYAPSTYLAVRSVDPKIRLQQDGFYYTLTDKQKTSSSVVLKSITLCQENFPSFELVRIKTNASLDAALHFANQETPIAINMYRTMAVISIGVISPVLISETELCDYNPTCDLLQTDHWHDSQEDYGLLSGKIIAIRCAPTLNNWLNVHNKYRALCKANYLGLEN